jgi:hypothetical protein
MNSTTTKTVKAASAIRQALASTRGRLGARALGAIAALAMSLGSLASSAEAAPPETAPIWRAQLRFRTCDSANAETNNPVFASLRTGNRTVLDYGRNDFPRNNTFTYDLVLNGVSRFENVTRLRVSKTGTDGLCIRSLELLLNNRSIFLRDFGAAGFFLDGGGAEVAVSSSGADMRASTRWINYQMPFPPLVIPRAEMESRVESMAGTAIFGTPAHWGHLKNTRFVEATRVNASTLHLDLDAFVDTLQAMSMISGFDLLAEVLSFFGVVPPNPDLDVDFDLGVSCSANQMSFAVANASVNVNSIPTLDLPNIPFPGLANVDDFVEGELNALLDEAEALLEAALSIDAMETAFADSLSRINFSSETPICPQITVQTNADIVFSL